MNVVVMVSRVWPPGKGEFVLRGEEWYHGCAQCSTISSLEDHRFDEALLTVTPSIVCALCEAHYFVYRGVIREAVSGR